MSLDQTISTVTTPDGRSLEVLVEGSTDGRALLFHSGTPSGVTTFSLLAKGAADRGLRLVSYSRPGYGDSTVQPSRSVADVADDVSAILDALDAELFLTLGWSGGGPHALACAALLPERCTAAAVLAGVAPFYAEGLNWFNGMGPENVEEFGATLAGVGPLTEYLQRQRADLQEVTGEQVAEALGGLVPSVDKSALTGQFADEMAQSFRRAVLRGIEGWRDDDLAFVQPWGFDLQSLRVPVALWQGRLDRMVPFAHGQWLADHVAGARVHLFDDEGHLSLMHQVDRILDDLLDLAAGV
jgi:pimeloyl-ACP methyl ester carboxylesterase